MKLKMKIPSLFYLPPISREDISKFTALVKHIRSNPEIDEYLRKKVGSRFWYCIGFITAWRFEKKYLIPSLIWFSLIVFSLIGIAIFDAFLFQIAFCSMIIYLLYLGYLDDYMYRLIIRIYKEYGKLDERGVSKTLESLLKSRVIQVKWGAILKPKTYQFIIKLSRLFEKLTLITFTITLFSVALGVLYPWCLVIGVMSFFAFILLFFLGWFLKTFAFRHAPIAITI